MKAKNRLSIIAVLLVEFVTLSTSGCGGGQSAPPPISVSISSSAQTIDEGRSVSLTATVANDLASKGVTWKLSGLLPGGKYACANAPNAACGTLSNQTATSVTYTAPSPVSADLSVTVVATSVADPTKNNFVSITVPAIAVSVAPSSASVQTGSTQSLTATVNYDPSNQGVNWTLTCSAAPCGSLSSATSASGAAITYSTPANIPASDVSVTITATSVTDPSKSSTASITVPAIAVTVAPSPVIVPAGTTQSFTTTVSYDPSNKGVTWTLSPASGMGTLSNMTSTSATYNAPASAPASDQAVTLTATSITDPSKSASANITVPAIVVSPVSPDSALIPINATQQFTATVQYDPANSGVTWAPMQGGASCAPTCGVLAPASTASGAPSTYTAPTAVPANPSVTITATSVSDTTKSNSAVITLTNGTVKLVPASLNFGYVKHGTTSSLTVSLTNTGNTTLSITSMTTTANFSQTNDCQTSVGAGKTCTITVAFSPNAVGSFSGTLTINDSSVDSPQLVSLSGMGALHIASPIPSALAAERIVAAPTPTGSNAVGTTVMNLVDTTRSDPFLANGTKRELLVRFWYPATLTEGCKPAEYTSPAVWSYFSQLLGVPLPEVGTNSCLNAAVTAGAHPVVVFTHGYTGTFTDYTYLFEDLASRGYVIASVNHTYEATAVEFPDGRLVKSLFGSHLGSTLRTDEEAYTSAVAARLNDLKFVADELARMNAQPDNLFAGKLDISRIAIAGHSLGGLTAALGVEQEPRFKAGIILDGVAPDRAVNATETPVLILITGRNQLSVEECGLWNKLQGPRLAVSLPGAEHVAPSDAVWLAKGAVKTGGLGPDKTIAAFRNYIAAFLDTNLRGQPLNALLTGPSPDCRDVAVPAQAQSLSGKE